MGSIDKACISGFLCRLCSEMHRIVIHIYGDQGQRLCLVEKINGYLPITISPTDPLPKTICTTCLRRVEQHYDLLMRLSRIKEERFLRVNNKVYNRQRPRVSPISSIDNSEDEVYQSDDESNRRQQQETPRSADSEIEQSNLASTTVSTAPIAFSAGSSNRPSLISAVLIEDESSSGAHDIEIEASTSARAMASTSHYFNEFDNTNMVDSLSASTSTSPQNISNETGNSIALQQLSD